VEDRQHGSKNRCIRYRRGRQERAGDDAPAGAGSILKALRILECIVEDPAPVSVAELATILGISKPTTHRIASFLEEFGFLEREPSGRRFVESQRLIELLLNVLPAAARRPNRRGILEWVVEETGETCNFGVMHRGELVYLDRVEAEWPLSLRYDDERSPEACKAAQDAAKGHDREGDHYAEI
jgi:IclR family acetate operon transcriptional repressor